MIVLIATLFAGCSSSFSPQILEPASASSFRDGDRVTVNDKWAEKAVELGSARSQRTENDRLSIDLEFVSKVDRDTQLQVRTVFRDSDNLPVKGDDTGWQVFMVPAGSSKVLSRTSLSTKAQGYSVELRTPGAQ